MASWQPLRNRLKDVDDAVTLPWQTVDDLVGGLPPSAYDHPAFWSGERTGWPGFRARDVEVGRSVTFVREHSRAENTTSPARPAPVRAAPTHGSEPSRANRVILVSCSSTKLVHSAPAADLYASPLFRAARGYAESRGAPWYVLSAGHGLVEPSTVLEPYDLALAGMNADDRRNWASEVLQAIGGKYGCLDGITVELHAGNSYTADLAPLLRGRGAEVLEPLAGLAIGQRLAWYASEHASAAPPKAHVVRTLISALNDESRSLSPAELRASSSPDLRRPGLYSWWVDDDGARDLSQGLGCTVAPGLIYAGLAGATRRRSGETSSNTLWGRLVGMHLGGRYRFSTFRYSLGAILASIGHQSEIDEIALTSWMDKHLRVVAVAGEPDTLDAVESVMLGALQPPLNLSKVESNSLRRRLTALRRRHRR